MSKDNDAPTDYETTDDQGHDSNNEADGDGSASEDKGAASCSDESEDNDDSGSGNDNGSSNRDQDKGELTKMILAILHLLMMRICWMMRRTNGDSDDDNNASANTSISPESEVSSASYYSMHLPNFYATSNHLVLMVA